MYFNTKLIAEKDLTLKDILNLQLIHQNKTEDHSLLLESTVSTPELQKYQERAYIEYVKPKKKGQSPAELLRLSSKGKSVLEEVQIPEISEQDLIIFNWLSGIYKNMDKSVGNAKKSKLFIALFRAHSGISENCLAYLCKTFINDTSQMEYSHNLQYLFFKPDNVFTTKFDIDSSRLYKYYLNRKEEFEKIFVTLR